MKYIIRILLAFFAALALNGCATTAMYTSPSVIDRQNHIYNFSIETGGYAGETEADERARNEIQHFMNGNDFNHYKILNRTNLEMFSGYKYAVQFYR